MTRERAIQIMSNYDLNFHEINGKLFDYGEVAEAFDMAIKALEQQVMLDKIRAEIEVLEEGIFSYYNDRPWIFKDEVLGIIDKYKTESEDKE